MTLGSSQSPPRYNHPSAPRATSPALSSFSLLSFFLFSLCCLYCCHAPSTSVPDMGSDHRRRKLRRTVKRDNWAQRRPHEPWSGNEGCDLCDENGVRERSDCVRETWVLHVPCGDAAAVGSGCEPYCVRGWRGGWSRRGRRIVESDRRRGCERRPAAVPGGVHGRAAVWRAGESDGHSHLRWIGTHLEKGWRSLALISVSPVSSHLFLVRGMQNFVFVSCVFWNWKIALITQQKLWKHWDGVIFDFDRVLVTLFLKYIIKLYPFVARSPSLQIMMISPWCHLWKYIYTHVHRWLYLGIQLGMKNDWIFTH